jgi:transcriptional regulator with XRE-family HTH domain
MISKNRNELLRNRYYFDSVMKKPPSSFGVRLRSQRLANGLTQVELGRRAGLSPRMVVHYEKYIKRPPAEKISALAEALGVRVEKLLYDTAPEMESTNTSAPFARKLEKAKRLPDDDQVFLSTVIDNLLKKNGLGIKRPRKNGR